jgi:hypothetical protein
MSVRSDADVALAPASGYIRGGGGIEIARHRIATVALGCAVVLLLFVGVMLAIDAATENSRIDLLRAHGVPVNVTVSSCLGMASGTGITASSFQCRGTFTVSGHAYDEVIEGSVDNRAPGDILNAVVVPSDPAIVYTSVAAAQLRPSGGAFVTPAILMALALGLGGAVAGWRRRTPGARVRRSNPSFVYERET